MARIIFAASALLVFSLQPAAAYEPPWCAVISLGQAACIGTAGTALLKNACRMCCRAIVAGAIRTRTLSGNPSRPGLRSGARARSKSHSAAVL